MLGANVSMATSSEKGGVQEMLNDVSFSEILKSFTDDKQPKQTQVTGTYTQLTNMKNTWF